MLNKSLIKNDLTNDDIVFLTLYFFRPVVIVDSYT